MKIKEIDNKLPDSIKEMIEMHEKLNDIISKILGIPKKYLMEETHTQRRAKNIDLKPMQDAGFNLLAFSIMMCEDTFYFATAEEANDAWNYFENGENATGEYVGFWYSIEDIDANIAEYKEDIGYEPEIIYLNDK